MFELNSNLACDFTVVFDCVIGVMQFIGEMWRWGHFGVNSGF